MDNIFCENCNNLFDIKTHTNEQEVEVISTSTNVNVDYKELLQKVENDKPLTFDELKTIDIKELMNNEYYKKMAKKGDIKKKIIDMIDDMVNSDEKTNAYMVCQNCGFILPIKPGSRIITKTPEGVNAEYEYINETSYRNKVFINTTPRTKAFTCTNNKCPVYVKKLQPEAVFFRKNMGTYETIYVCVHCLTIKY